MKKIVLFLLLLPVFCFPQDNNAQEEICGTPAPDPRWDEWFNKEVEKYKENLKTGKARMVNYTIPVVVHIIHWGEAVGTYPNISQAQGHFPDKCHECRFCRTRL
jgi:hypothetical protein